MADLKLLQDHLGALLTKLSAQQIRKLSTEIGRKLRQRQQTRITAQKNPDGSQYTPRKPQRIKLRDKKGRIKTKMFNKIKNASYLKVQGTARGVAIQFSGRIANIARIHQYGLRDRPRKTAREVQYSKRELLGFSTEDDQLTLDMVLDYLQSDFV